MASHNGLWLETRAEVTTHIILTTQLLTLSSAQLEEAIAAELEANPALEQVPTRRCPSCGGLITGAACPNCLARLTGARPQIPDGYGSWDYISPRASRQRPDDDDEEPELQEYVAQPVTLGEHVLAQVGPALTPEERVVARDILDNLDERGYYIDVPEAAAERLGVPVARVLAVLRVVQSADPAGVAARDLRECLLLQLACLQALGTAPPIAHLAERLLREELPQLGSGDLAGVARRLDCEECDAAEALAFVKSNLAPFPALTHWESPGRGTAESYPRPDAAVFLKEDGELGFELFVPGPEWLRIDPLYRRCAGESGPGADQCRNWVDRASLFIKCLGQSKNAFARLIAALVREQRDYFLYGDRALHPMTRAQLAGVVGVHESTISRAVAHKYVAVPTGRLIPLAHLFDGSVPVKDVLAELVAHETRPLTDDELARELERRGHPLARRTVAKYRAAIGILPAHLRRSVRRANGGGDAAHPQPSAQLHASATAA